MRYICALTIAGSDSCGGAGVQADIKTMSALGVYAEIVAGQIKAVMDDIQPNTVKIGMVNDKATIQTIADTLKLYPGTTLVVDPVMVSTSGSMLMQQDALDVFCRQLLPMANLLTPNIPEASVLSHTSIQTADDMDQAALRILSLGCEAVLIKGGHLEGDRKIDKLYLADGRTEVYEHATIETRNTHGTGCTLSSAIASFLARGLEMCQAIAQAKDYLSQAIEAGKDVEIGKGHGPVDHFFNPEKLKIW